MHYLTKKDLAEKTFGLEKYTPGDDSTKRLAIHITSGTTKSKPLMDIIEISDEECGHHHRQRIETYMPLMPRVFLDQLLFIRAPSHVKQLVYLDAKDLESPHLGRIIKDLQSIDFYTTPSLLNFFVDTLRQSGETEALRNVHSYSLVGEVVSRAFLYKLKKIMPQATVGEETEYGLSEVPRITRWCSLLAEKYRDKNMELQVYHPYNEKHCSMTILNPDEEGRGEIVVTTPALSNYRTGDHGALIDEECSCGAQRTLVVYGRENYDIVRCIGATILLSELEHVFEGLKEYIADYYVEVHERDDGLRTVGELTFFIVPTEKLTKKQNPQNFVATIMGKRLPVTPTQTLGDLIEQGLFLYSEVRLVERILLTGAKKIKLKKIV